MTNQTNTPQQDTSLAAWAAGGEAITDVEPSVIGELLNTLVKGLRAFQLYQPNNPVYQKFVVAVRTSFTGLWTQTSVLKLIVEENGFRWGEHKFPIGEGRDSLPFLFYKDGIRSLTFSPGFEEEVQRFLSVVQRAKQADPQGDDLITLLWEQEFAAFQYGYVDLLAEGVELPALEGVELVPIQPQAVEADAAGETDEPPRPSEQRAQEAPAPEADAFSREDFVETLYFLDEAELQALQREVELEMERDLKRDVLSALFDRLEEQAAERQTEILAILRQLLPTFLARGDLVSAGTVVRDLGGIMDIGIFTAEHRAEIDHLFDALSDPTVLNQLVRGIEDGVIHPDAEELSLFLSHLRSSALPELLRAVHGTAAGPLKEKLQGAIDRLAGQHGESILELLRSADPAIATGSAKLVGRLNLTKAGPDLGRLLEREDALVRLAAVEGMIALKTSVTVEHLQRALEDADRDVRIAAVRGLSALKYAPARARIEAALQERVLKSADLTEKMAFFEAYAVVGGAATVEFLDKLLNGKGGLLGRKQPSDVRACAAMALGKLGLPAAKNALERAANESDAVVKTAVARALRLEVPAS